MGKLWFGVLGPLAAQHNGAAIPVVGDRRRVLLATLLLHAGTPVSTDRLIDALWTGEPPRLARQALHNQVKRLRDVLGDEVASRLGTAADGYLLDLAEEELDTRRFAALESAGRKAADAADWERAADLSTEALSLWRGEPLSDLPDRSEFTDAAEHWRARRLQAERLRLDALHHLGRHADLPGPLAKLIREHPLDEGLRGQLMLALFLGNRQAEALAVFDETRRILVDQLGIEPGPELRRLHQRILRADSTLALHRTSTVVSRSDATTSKRPEASAATAADRSVPQQLPATIRHFVGRTDQLEALEAVSRAERSGEHASTVLTIDGTAGVGKTALAVHWAHRVAGRFPDGQLYTNLRGFDPSSGPAAPAEALHRFLTALGFASQRIPAGLEERAALYRSATAGRRMLIILDNAHDAEQVRPLLPGSSGCLVLVTSRVRLAGLVASDGAQPLALDRLTAEEARQLLDRRLGPERTADEAAAVEQLAQLCARLPLALNITAARALTEPGRPLAELTADLREASGRDRLDAFSAGDAATDVRAVFSWSYRKLSADAAMLFRLLGGHPGPDISEAAAASLSGRGPAATRRLLDELVHAHLLSRLPGPRYTFHDLLRAYAAELVAEYEDEDEWRAAMLRAHDHYLHTAHQAALHISAGRTALALGDLQPGALPEDIPDGERAHAWFEAEHAVLIGLVEQAGRAGLDVHAWQLPWSVAEYLDRLGRFAEIVATQRTAMAAADRLGDRVAQAHAFGSLGRALVQLGEHQEGLEQLTRSLEMQRELGDEPQQALTHTAIAHMHAMRGEHKDALQHGELALELCRRTGHLSGQSIALNVVGWCHTQLGEYDKARECCRESIELSRTMGNRTAEGAALDSLGEVHHHLGAFAEAADSYRQAADLRLELRHFQHAAASLTRLGETGIAAGDLAAARRAWAEALAILDGLDHPDAAALRTRLRDLASEA